MNKKINVGLLFGGKSPEHEVSLQSARTVFKALDPEKYHVTLIGIDKQGKWHLYHQQSYLINANDPKRIELGEKKQSIEPLHQLENSDVIFPALHGPLGEDGTVQGLCKLADVPFVGAGVLGSAVCMDKDVMKRLFNEANIPTPKFCVFHKKPILDEIPYSFPFFVKPANMGSSIGISKVKNESEFSAAIEEAFCFDRKIIIEENIEGREIQCSIMGNENPTCSLPCEIIPHGDFHSYASKYIDSDGAQFIIPVELDVDVSQIALKAYKALCCEGFARIDMFLNKNGDVLVNEINTIPGLTKMSPYAKMWQASGLSYKNMIDQLIELAMMRYKEGKTLISTYQMVNA